LGREFGKKTMHEVHLDGVTTIPQVQKDWEEPETDSFTVFPNSFAFFQHPKIVDNCSIVFTAFIEQYEMAAKYIGCVVEENLIYITILFVAAFVWISIDAFLISCVKILVVIAAVGLIKFSITSLLSLSNAILSHLEIV